MSVLVDQTDTRLTHKTTAQALGLSPDDHRVALISCSASKLNRAAPARELYTSTLFKKSVAYAEQSGCDAWYVLSAKHGLVHPDTVLEPYDHKLTQMPTTVDGRQIPSPWAGDLSRALLREFNVTGLLSTTFVVLAGGVYEANVRTLSLHTQFPLAGKQIGQRLQWLTQHTPSATSPPAGRARASA